MERRTGYTTNMLRNSILHYEEAIVFPCLFVFRDLFHAEAYAVQFADMFNELKPVLSKNPFKAVFKGGSEFLFVSEGQLGRMRRNGINYCAVYFDNGCRSF